MSDMLPMISRRRYDQPIERAFFAPAQPQYFSKKSPWFGYKPTPYDFESGNLVITQEQNGDYSWTHYGSIFDEESEVKVRPSFLTTLETLQTVKNKALYISETDPRLSDYDLVSMTSRPRIRVAHDSNIPDLVSMHLASCRQVNILKKEPNGKRSIDDRSTEDYWRAKMDIKNNPSKTDNLIRFCNRQGPSGEGPSCLSRRVCHGTTRPPPSSSSTPATRTRTPSASHSVSPPHDLDSLTAFFAQDHHVHVGDFSATAAGSGLAGEPEPEPERKRHSKTYRLMRLACVSKERLAREQWRFELKCARREKAPERVARGVRGGDAAQWELWAVVRRRARVLFVGRGWNRGVGGEDEDEDENENEMVMAAGEIVFIRRGGESVQSGAGEEVGRGGGEISPLTLPGPTVRVDAAGAVGWVETVEFMSGRPVYQLKHDSIGEGITEAEVAKVRGNVQARSRRES